MAKSSQIACLIAVNPTDSPREFALREPVTLVGSDPTNDLVIRGGTVSRRHATIEYRDDRYEVTDLASTNGTFVNDQRVSGSMPIKQGDEIRFGQARFLLWVPSAGSFPSEEQQGSSAFSKRATLVALALTVVLSVGSGLIGGVIAATRVHGVVVARQFVLVGQDGKARGLLMVFPQSGELNCGTCDGKAHLVVFGKEGEPAQVWPPSGPSLSNAQVLFLIRTIAKLAGIPIP